MKLLKYLFFVIAVILLISMVAAYLYAQSLKPDLEGELTLEGLSSPVDVRFDKFGVPHIYAQNELDAQYALGYIHAQDRLWQMELIRRLGHGRLAEILGPNLVKTDRFFRTIGTGEKAKKDADRFNVISNNDPMKQAALAYLKGINAFLENGTTPVEFRILGIEKEDYTIEDIYATSGYMAFSFAQGWRTDPLVTRIQQKWGADYLDALDVHWSEEAQVIPVFPQPLTQVEEGKQEVQIGFNSSTTSPSIDELFNTLPVPTFIGSNSWVIGPSKTKSSKVIFANDTHIGYAQPSVWYEAHIEYPGHRYYGSYLAGIPFPVIGHNDHHAMGITMFENDDIDLYVEKVNPENENQVWFKDHWEDMQTRQEYIKVKNGDDISFEVKTSRHGPIINNAIEDVRKMTAVPIASWWTFNNFPNQSLEAFYGMIRAKSMDEVRRGAARIHAPGLNIMYGDVEGNIAWWASAKLPIRREGVNSKLFLDGSSGEDEILGYIDFKDNPHSENPPSGYVYSANNQPDTIAGILHAGYYIPEDRARRIMNILESSDSWDITAVQKMILDVNSPKKVAIVKDIIRLVNASGSSNENALKAIQILNAWDGDSELEDVAPTLYAKLYYRIMENTFEDELGEKDFQTFLQTVIARRSYPFLLKNQNASWWDDQSTPNKKESRKDIVQAAFNETLSELDNQLGSNMDDWTWGKVYTLTHKHTLGKDPNLAKLFDVGPLPTAGNNEVINNMSYHPSKNGKYEVKSGPALRRIIDFSDFERGVSVLPTGQSGNPMSPHYQDQAMMFVNGAFRTEMMNREEIEASSTLLRLVPE